MQGQKEFHFFLKLFCIPKNDQWNFADFQILTYQKHKEFKELNRSSKGDIKAYISKLKKIFGDDAFNSELKGISLSDLRQTLSDRDNKRFQAIAEFIIELKQQMELFRKKKDPKNNNTKKDFQFLSYIYDYCWYGEFNITEIDFEKAEKSFLKAIQSN